MKITGIVAATVLFSVFATPSFAQSDTPPAAAERPNAQPRSNSGSEPQDKGSTGWTGGARDQGATSGQSSAQSDAAAQDQPLMATGADLSGPPKRFPPNKTPE